jgi:hypothetical protein
MQLGKLLTGLALSGSVIAIGAAQLYSPSGGRSSAAATPKLHSAVQLSETPLNSQRRLTPASLTDAKHAAFQGGAATLSFIDGAIGNPEHIRARAGQLLDAITADNRFKSPEARQIALQSLQAAVNTALQTSYISPAVVDNNFVPEKTSTAWDVGGRSLDRTSLGYDRLGADSARLQGASLKSIIHNGDTGALSDSLANIQSVNLNLDDGDYQVVVLANSKAAKGSFAPFGKQVAVGGEVRRVVGVGGTSNAAYLHFVNRSIATKSGALANGTDAQESVGSPAYMAALKKGDAAVALSIPAHAANGKLQINFVPLKNHDTMISSIVAVRADYRALKQQIETRIAAAGGSATQLAALNNNSTGNRPVSSSPVQIARIKSSVGSEFASNNSAENLNALAPAAGKKRPRSVAVAAPMAPTENALSMTLNSVTKERALDGLMSGTKAGMELTQAYLDQAGGDTLRLQNRALSLLDGMNNTQISGDFVTLADATNKVTEATEKAAAAGYYMNYKLRGFRIGRNNFGIDFGPGNKSTYGGFKRITQANTSAISGPRLETIDRGMGKVGIANDAIKGATSLKVNAPDGLYKVYLLAPVDYAQPFGAATTLNGQKVRLVDLREPTRPPVWKLMTEASIKAKGGLESIVSGLDTAAQIEAARSGKQIPIKIGAGDFDVVSGSHYCLMLATRARVKDGVMTFDFDPGAFGPTALAALVAEPDDIDGLRRALADKIASQLANLAPAAGVGINGPLAFNNLSGPLSPISAFGNGGRGSRGIPGVRSIGGPGAGGGNQVAAATTVPTPVPTAPTPTDPPATSSGGGLPTSSTSSSTGGGLPTSSTSGGDPNPGTSTSTSGGNPTSSTSTSTSGGNPTSSTSTSTSGGNPTSSTSSSGGGTDIPPAPAPGPTITIKADAGIDCVIELGDILMFDGTASSFTGTGFDPALLKVEWLLLGDMDMILANGFGTAFLKTGEFITGAGSKFLTPGRYEILLRLTYGTLVSTDRKIITIVNRAVDEPATYALLGLGLAGMWWRRRKQAPKRA